MSYAYLSVTPCHDAVVLPYAAYLRVYEPLAAFPGAQQRHWAAYAASPARSYRAGALAAEQSEAVRRMVALPPVAVPDRESGDAYLRWSDAVPYICPWQTRLRSRLALARLVATMPTVAAVAFPGGHPGLAEAARPVPGDAPGRVYIKVSTWSVPFTWFVLFAADERWLVLGEPTASGDGGRATAAGTRSMIYATTMAQARHRVAHALSVIGGAEEVPAVSFLAGAAPSAGNGLEEVGHWLGEFHSQALVELDYGGLVHLLDDSALCADQSVAEISATVTALAAGEVEFATAMCQRFIKRWRALEALEQAS